MLGLGVCVRMKRFVSPETHLGRKLRLVSLAFWICLASMFCGSMASGQATLEIPEAIAEDTFRSLATAQKAITEGKATKAINILDTAFERIQKLTQDPNPYTAAVLDETSRAYQQLGKQAEATALAQAALDMRVVLYPAEKFPLGHPQVILGLANTAENYRRLGNLGNAEQLIELAHLLVNRLIDAGVIPPEHPMGKTLANYRRTITNTYGVVLLDKGDHENAAKHLNEALAMTERLYPKDRFPQGHEKILQTLNNLSLIHISEPRDKRQSRMPSSA